MLGAPASDVTPGSETPPATRGAVWTLPAARRLKDVAGEVTSAEPNRHARSSAGARLPTSTPSPAPRAARNLRVLRKMSCAGIFLVCRMLPTSSTAGGFSPYPGVPRRRQTFRQERHPLTVSPNSCTPTQDGHNGPKIALKRQEWGASHHMFSLLFVNAIASVMLASGCRRLPLVGARNECP
jgi:hypothetical protein